MDKESNVLAIISLFRNRGIHTERYIKRIEGLEWDGPIHVVAVENDSTDATREILESWSKKHRRKTDPLKIHVIGEKTGEPMTVSEVSKIRFKILADAANKGFDYLSKIKPDYVMFIESDIIYSNELCNLLKDRVDKVNGVVAPMNWTERDKIFYDFWGYRINGIGFPSKSQIWYTKYFPYVDQFEIDSAGTCLMMKYDWVKDARLTEDEAIVGLCKEIKNKEGVKIYCDRDIHVFHPQ